ncbi:MAG: hypothetical protein K2W92_03985 [Alphaproteobacteria bacterium]|nr:hypothetical protein [Alphaproteobacteria bacterium]
MNKMNAIALNMQASSIQIIINSSTEKMNQKIGELKMDISIFLAKAIGFYYIIMSLSFFIKKRKLKLQIINIMNNPALMLVTSFIALIMGILIVVSHNIWTEDWRVIITIVGWMVLIKGINIILFPEFLVNMSIKWIQNNIFYYTTFSFVFLIGTILIYYGYAQS